MLCTTPIMCVAFSILSDGAPRSLKGAHMSGMRLRFRGGFRRTGQR